MIDRATINGATRANSLMCATYCGAIGTNHLIRAISCMPKIVSSAELSAVVAAVADGGDGGVGVDALGKRFPELPRRTLQRRLAKLVQEGRLSAIGNGPARRYCLPERETDAGSADAPAYGVAPIIDVRAARDDGRTTPAANKLRQAVRQPLSQRVPVGYRREFLDAYVPNESFYLPGAVREHLHGMGRSSTGTARPAGTYARQILNRLLVDLSWASSRLEGNTYSRLDTQNLIEFGYYADGKDRLEAQMILNHKAAIEMLVTNAGEIGFNRYTVQNLHALLADNLLTDADACGRLRAIEVAIGGTVYYPTAVPQLIVECFDTLLAKARDIEDPFEQAFFVMVQLPYLQPFEDVNKRVSRLAANIPFIQGNLAPIAFVDVPEKAYVDGTLAVYELNRVELLRDVFVWAYERSCRRYTLIREALPEPDPLRLRYRAVLTDVISHIVHTGAEATAAVVRKAAGQVVAPEDMREFAALVINELGHLHEGNIARYRLTLSEFRQWRKGRMS